VKPQSKRLLLEQMEAEVEKHIDTAVSLLQNQSSAVLTKSSGAQNWSIAQCLWHLNSYSTYYHSAIEREIKKADKGNGDEFFTSGFLGNWFVKLMKPGKLKLKAFAKHSPPMDVDGNMEVALFIQLQEDLLQLLRNSREANLNKIKIPISITSLVKLPLGDVFQFVIMHNERHLQQALKILNDAYFA